MGLSPERARAGLPAGQEQDAALRVLVLTSRTGGGHDARAEAFKSWVEKLYGKQVAVLIDHTLEDSSPWYAFGVSLYNTIQRRLPAVHHLYYHLGELFGLLQQRRVSVGLAYFDRMLRKVRPDVILSVHSILNKGYFRHAKQVLGEQVTCVTYCGEFKGSYGFSRNWVAAEVDLFFGRTEHTLVSAKKLGLPPDKARCLSHLLKPSFYRAPMSAAKKAAFLAGRLGLDPTRFTLLLSTGGAGAQNHIALLNKLLPHAQRIQVIVVHGRSARAGRRLEAWREAHPALRLALISHTEQMERLLQVASAVVARPGTTTSAEALQLGCPIIFNRIGGAMPQEYCTLRFFRMLALAPDIRSPADLPRRVGPWLDHPQVYAAYLERFRAARTEDDPRALVEAILGPGAPAPGRQAGPAARPEPTALRRWRRP